MAKSFRSACISGDMRRARGRGAWRHGSLGIGTLALAIGVIAGGCTAARAGVAVPGAVKGRTPVALQKSASVSPGAHPPLCTGLTKRCVVLKSASVLPGLSPKGDSVSSKSLASAVSDGRFVHPVNIGGLHIAPATLSHWAAPLGLDLAEAKRYVGLTGGPMASTPGPKTVGYGMVSLTGVAMPAGTPVLTARLAWVGIVLGSNDGAINCPAETAPEGSRPSSSGSGSTTFHFIDNAVIFYGQSGQGAVTYSTGGSLPCGGTIGPRVAVADAVAPVAWHQLTPASLYHTIIGYQAPVCAHLASVDSSGNVHTGINTVSVIVAFPFDRTGTGCQAVRQFTTTVFLYPANPGPGAPPPPSRIILKHSSLPAFTPPLLIGPISG
ncbi:MAG: hypothetical protein ACYDGY_07145 [Acidimicrobiales bacterium]